MGVVVEQLGVAAKLIGAELLERHALAHAVAHDAAHHGMRLAERQALAHEVVSQVRGRHVALVGGLAHALLLERAGGEHARAGHERAEHRVGGVEQRLLVLLEVLVVGERRALHRDEQAREVADDASGLAAHELGEVGVLLLRHDRGTGGVGVIHLHEAKLGRAPPHELLAQPGQVHLAHAAGVDEVEKVVAVAHGVHGVGRGAREAQGLGRHVAVERVGGAGERRGAQRADVRGLARGGHAAEVPVEHPEVGEQVVAQQHRLGGLHVRVARHDDAELALGTVEQHGLELGERGEDLIGEVACDEVRIHGRLVVAGAARVEAPAGRSDVLGQDALDGHVDVLVAVDVKRELAALDLVGDVVEAGADGVGVLLRDDALVGEHGGVGLGAADVLAPHALVKRQRGAEALKLAGGGGGEAACPQGLGGIGDGLRRCVVVAHDQSLPVRRVV